MTQATPPQSTKSGFLTGRRIVLLASVAAVGGALLLAGPGGYWGSALGTPPAHAADSSAAVQQPLPHPQGFADLVAKVKPAVISVRVKIPASAEPALAQQMGGGDDQQQIPVQPGSPLDKFFQQFGDQFGHQFGHNAPQGHETIVGEGSGFFISPDGYAVTNNHVVNHASSVQVTTDNGTIYTAKVIGTDPKTDLALIKVDGKNDFPYVQFASHRPKVGDWVVAVGNPFGLGGTVTAGIVSARGRDIGSGPYDDFLQIDAPVNHGNSGGPTFNAEGEVVGVNTAIFSPSGGSVGIGFAIASDVVKSVVQQLKENGSVTRGWIGVQIQSVTPDLADNLGLKNAAGALVAVAQKDSPAAEAGVKSGDVITAVDGEAVADPHDLARRIAALGPKKTAKLSIVRAGSPMTIDVTLGAMPADKTASVETRGSDENEGSALAKLGLTLRAGHGQDGVVVSDVDPDGAAADKGLKEGDVILEVAGKPVSRPSEVAEAISAARSDGKNSVLLRVKSGDGERFLTLPTRAS
jgi:serine protease Do